MNNTENFTAILVKPFEISGYDWGNATYMEDLLNNENCSIVELSYNPDIFLKEIAIYLEIDKYNDPDITPHIIGYNHNYTYEIIYCTLEARLEEVENIKHNTFGTLIDLQGKEVFGNLLILKLSTPYTDYSTKYVNITKKDLIEHLNTRVHTKVVVYEDNQFREEDIPGNTEYFAEVFFEEDYSRIKKIELAFLKHNITIWYLEDSYGDEGVFGKLINEKSKVFKGFIFTQLTNNLRGNLTLDEVNKIIYLSKKMDNYILSDNDDLVKTEKDENMKTIIKNKYRILENVYNQYK